MSDSSSDEARCDFCEGSGSCLVCERKEQKIEEEAKAERLREKR